MLAKYVITLSAVTSLLLLSAVPTYAQTTAYDVQPQAGNQAWPGNMGLDFDINSPVTILSIGAFDNNTDGFTGTVTVGIFSRTTGQAVTPSVTISGTVGKVFNGNRFVALQTPVLLPAGQYSVVAVGFNDIDLNGNVGLGGPLMPSTMNTGGNLITFTGTGRYDASTTLEFPNIIDSGPLNRYLAGTFQFSAIPLPPPILTKTFQTPNAAGAMNAGETIAVTFTVQNPNTSRLTGIAFKDSDSFPQGLVVATPNGVTGSCGGGTITAIAASSSISLSGATLEASSSCTFTVNVTAVGSGPQVNTTGTVMSTEALPGAPATATVFVYDWWFWWF